MRLSVPKKPPQKRSEKATSPSSEPKKGRADRGVEPVPKRVGRPPRGEEAASVAILVRLTRAEKATIEAAARRAGKILSVYVRDLLLCESR